MLEENVVPERRGNKKNVTRRTCSRFRTLKGQLNFIHLSHNHFIFLFLDFKQTPVIMSSISKVRRAKQIEKENTDHAH